MSVESLVYETLSKSNKAVKTKHLAERLGIERTELVAALNTLADRKKIAYVFTPPRSHETICGWIINNAVSN